MAVFYKGIKGCSTGASLNKGLWTYINWSNGDKNYIQSDKSLPKIGVKFDGGSEVDLGHILTDNVACTINQPWHFNKKIITNQMGSEEDLLEISAGTEISLVSDSISLGDTTATWLSVKGSSGTVCDITNQGNITTQGNITATGWIKTDQYMQALYFNATSDIRAKTDIKQLNIKAAELIKDLSIYTFKYKENNEPSIGIMAQDLLKLQPDGLDLVVNKNATGKDNDYMSIKEDKLIYILMKAIQEQQSEIEALKSKIDLLTK